MAFWRWAWWKGVARKAWLELMGFSDAPWVPHDVWNLEWPGVRAAIARAEADNERELGAGIVRKFSRDPVVERRERLVEARAAREAAAAAARKPTLKWRAQ